MKPTAERQWWDGQARRRLTAAVGRQARQWQTAPPDSVRERFDAHSRWKVGLLFAGFGAVFLLHAALAPQAWLTALAVGALGLFFIPYTRIFMHSQMHWGMGGGVVLGFLLEHGVSLLFCVPQTAYAVGHRMHHRHDNDYHPGGRPRDLQSTYLFSSGGRPSNMLLWVAYYMLVFQHVVAPWLVLSTGKPRERVWLLLEYAALAVFHAGLWALSPRSYWQVYLPALLLAWFSSAVVLYMMHAVDAHDYSVHPTNTSVSAFFNWFGDNDGYHLEHTLFPAVHPLYLPRLHRMIQPGASQILQDHYFIAGVKYAFSRHRATAHNLNMEKEST